MSNFFFICISDCIHLKRYKNYAWYKSATIINSTKGKTLGVKKRVGELCVQIQECPYFVKVYLLYIKINKNKHNAELQRADRGTSTRTVFSNLMPKMDCIS